VLTQEKLDHFREAVVDEVNTQETIEIGTDTISTETLSHGGDHTKSFYKGEINYKKVILISIDT
jgi:hypothetical protein